MSLYPFLFALFPVLSLYSDNVAEVPLADLALPIVITLVGTGLVYLITRKAIITVVAVALFFSYGYVRDFLGTFMDGITIGGFHITNQFLLMPLWAIIFIAVIVLRNKIHISTRWFNIISIVLLVVTLANAGINGLKTDIIDNKPAQATIVSNLPDVYYIILDGYARQDTLERVYGYNNSEFINYLKDKGFYVADNSQSNYASTTFSMPSSLNMEYLPYQEEEMRFRMWANSLVSQSFIEKGYEYIYVSGGLELKDMPQYANCLVFDSGKSDFMDSLSRTTALAPFLMYFEGFFGDNDRLARLYAFDELKKIPTNLNSTFTYAHILSPHPPFIFDSEGNAPERSIFGGTGNIWQSAGHETRYTDQVTFINSKIKETLDSIPDDAIIILQADHGIWWNADEGRNILNAYYFPDGDYSKLYKSISPVNSFRVLLGYDLLEDR